MTHWLKSAVFAALLVSPMVTLENAEADEALRASIKKDYDANLEALFKHFHANPELSFKETKTAKRLAKELRALGYKVTEKVGGTGIVAVLKNGDGPTVLLRADMDGLPIKEDTDLPYASKATQEDIDGQVKPVMHACGHDVHITSLVGTARQMAALKGEWSGTLVLIGQPAEERIGGARAMMQDGLYERFPKPDYALAFHVSSDLPAGKLVLPKAIAYSSSDSVDIVVHGVGTHGAAPHKGVDPVLVASQIVVSLQSIVSRTIPPLEPGVITVGAIHGGIKHNIIGDKVEMQLTVRSNSFETREKLLDGIDRVAKGTAIALGVPDDKLPEVIRSKTETTPPTINDTPTALRLEATFTENFGPDIFFDYKKDSMGAEDFAYFVAPDTGVKGVYFSVGGTKPEEMGNQAFHHSPFFKIDPEPAIRTGVEAMTVGAISLFKGE